MIIGNEHHKEIIALIRSTDTFRDYIETHDDYKEEKLTNLYYSLAADLTKLCMSARQKEKEKQGAREASRRIQRETEEYLATTTGEFRAYTE